MTSLPGIIENIFLLHLATSPNGQRAVQCLPTKHPAKTQKLIVDHTQSPTFPVSVLVTEEAPRKHDNHDRHGCGVPRGGEEARPQHRAPCHLPVGGRLKGQARSTTESW